MQQIYVFLADLVVAFHVAYVSFVVLGQLVILVGVICKWQWVRNRWFRLLHLFMITIVALETVVGMTCPLTTWENALRELGGQQSLEGDFIGRVLRDIIFLPLPDTHWIFKVMYFGFAGLVLLTLFLVPPRWKKPVASTFEEHKSSGVLNS